MCIRVQQETKVVSQHAIDFASLSAHYQLLLIIGKVHGHDTGVELSLMGQSPGTSRQVDFLNLAVTATDEEHLLVDAPTDDTVRGEWHRCAIELL